MVAKRGEMKLLIIYNKVGKVREAAIHLKLSVGQLFLVTEKLP